MSLFLNGKKMKIYLNGKAYKIGSALLFWGRLLSSDKYFLKDSNDQYLLFREG